MIGVIGRDVQAGSKLGHERLSNATEETVWQMQTGSRRSGLQGITTAQSNEHLRNRSEKAAEYAMKKGNYDPTREHLNFEIVNGGKVRPVDKSRSIRNAWQTISVSVVLKTLTRDCWSPNTGRWSHYPRRLPRTDAAACLGKQDVDFEQGADNSRIVRKPEIEQWAKDA